MWQLWIKNPTLKFEKLGPLATAVDANLWLQVLELHFGSGEVQLLEEGNLPAGDPRSWQNRPEEWWQ